MEYHQLQYYVLYFNSINYPVNYYIPNRLEEGYGINEDAIKLINDTQGCNVINKC